MRKKCNRTKGGSRWEGQWAEGADRSMACPEISVARVGQVSQQGIPRACLHRGAEAGPPDSLFLKCVPGLQVLCGTSMGESESGLLATA